MLKLTSASLTTRTIEALFIPVCEDAPLFDNPRIVKMTQKALKLPEFSGRHKERATYYDWPQTKIRRLTFTGVGKSDGADANRWRRVAGQAVQQAIHMGLKRAILAVPNPKTGEPNLKKTLVALMEGAALANQVGDAYKSDIKKRPLKEIHFWVPAAAVRKYRGLAGQVQTICMGTHLARQWVNAPANEQRPPDLARQISRLARKAGLAVTVMGPKELKAERYGALQAVTAGSDSPARMLWLEHRPQKAGRPIVLVGKGVTFDSGGLNLKTGRSLADMKMDMAGAAVVAAVLITVARLKSPLHIVGAIPIVENMVSGSATRPGDIITSRSGKTIEIGNTDAEGRLILADAMDHAIEKYHPQAIVDIATLTGACLVALGDKIAGVFSNEDALAEAIVKAGRKTGERCWRLPLPPDYKKMLKSNFADLKNIGSTRWGGAITAALFLEEFAAKNRWVHIDIAGPAYAQKETPLGPAGGTGFGVRLLLDYLNQI